MEAGDNTRAQAEPVSQIRLYQEWLVHKHGISFEDYSALWEWSTTDLNAFWRSIWDYYQITSPTPFTSVLDGTAMPGASWFSGAKVNYAHQVFRHADLADAAGQPAIIAEGEQGHVREISWRELKRQTASLALELRRMGVGPGDRVAAYLPNIPEAVTALLACASLGAIWTLCSPDMGTPAVIDRFKQTSPKVLISVDGVYYGGKAMDRSGLVSDMRAALPSVEAHIVIRTGYGAATVSNSLILPPHWRGKTMTYSHSSLSGFRLITRSGSSTQVGLPVCQRQ